ncbi:two-component system, OmpR family, sensor histidine kinase QseC [Halopseudomonas litoralis]|uniref:histidine kinase n=1 Tax=Halopseudomonas litoralis TaxID=797277 RepID=A0A1H1V817_9GAMM|nr:HAMP domain-containing sensor histidine kinase [Halopseudomonas litoralis]SDS80631.1 two-component system, OmpR family, sensor histidine kinase QseC [Halopseudomonas litoralis]
MPLQADSNLTNGSQPGRRLRSRMLIALSLVFVLGFGVSALHMYGTRDELRRAVLLVQAEAVSEGFTSDRPLAELPRYHAGGQMEYTLYAVDGQLLGYSDYMDRPRRLRTAALAPESSWWRWSPHGGYSINAPVRLPDGATLMVSRNDQNERAMLDQLLLERLRHSLILMLPVGLLCILLILLLLNWTLRPVRRAARLAQGIGPDTPERRIPLQGLPGEFYPLAVAANCALDRLARAYEAERRFIADAAHELRTPLAVLDLRLQDARHSGELDWPALEAEMRQLRRLVSQLLELAHQEGATERGGAEQQTNLSRLSREVTASLLPLFEAQGRGITVHIEDSLRCQGNTDELREVLVNLLDNALTHGAGTVQVNVCRRAEGIMLEVADEGPGVPTAEREAMFQRFRKGRRSGTGTGLGLAIVRRIVENAGGQSGFVQGRGNALQVLLMEVSQTDPV